jgi:hypothetical protein
MVQNESTIPTHKSGVSTYEEIKKRLLDYRQEALTLTHFTIFIRLMVYALNSIG